MRENTAANSKLLPLIPLIDKRKIVNMNIRNFTLIVIAIVHFGIGNSLYAMDDAATPTSSLWEIILRSSNEPHREQDHLEDAQQAINNGADIESRYRNCTPIMYAVLAKKKFLVSLLIHAGANINATTERESLSLLMLANNTKDNNAIFRQLLEAGANTDCQNLHAGDTVLHMIGIHDLSLEVAEERLCWLLHYGANTALRNHAGLTPFDQTSELIQQRDPMRRALAWVSPARDEDLFLELDILSLGTNHPAYKTFLHERVAEMCKEHNAENVHTMIREQQIYGPDASKRRLKLKTLEPNQ